MLALRRPLDRDNNDTKFEIVVGCDSLADKSIPRVNISVHLTVRDVNDNAPAFAQSEFSIQVPEELPEGTPIRLDFTATDIDEPGPNSYVHYRIMEDEMDPLISGLIHIPDRHVPEIVVGGRIDFERLRAFDLELEAEDDGSPSLHTRARLHVEVVDQDDLNPRFDYDFYSSSEMMEPLLQVYPKPIRARDQDSFNEALFYELSGENHQFYAINASGHVTMASNAFVATTLIVHARQVNRPEREATAILVISNHSTIHFQKDLYSIQ
ncbi:CDH-9 protein, partial [Aphelenchoides avenae]